MKFRELSLADAARVAELERILFEGDQPWTESMVRSELTQRHTFYVGAFDAPAGESTARRGGEGDAATLIGYAGLAMLGPREDPEFEIHTIGVDPAYQRRGVGRALMDQLVHTADLLDGPMFLEVRTDNVAAIAMYEAYGFDTIGVRKNYYQASGADAYAMMRPRRSEREGHPRGDDRDQD